LKVSVTVAYSGVAILNLEMMAGSVTVQLGTDATEYVVAHWGELKPRFETEASVVPPSPELAQQRAALLSEVTAKLQERLAGYQQALYAQIFGELTTGSLRTLTLEAAGSKALLDSFVILGLPRALAQDEFFHAMLFGNQQLVDDSEVIQSYALSATLPITEVNVLVNPRLVIKQSADERRVAFAEMLTQYLDAITAQTHVEGPDYIANTRTVFNLIMRIVQVAAATPDAGATVTGVLFNDANGNGAQEGGEGGIAGATVTLPGDNVTVAQARTTLTGADGVYTFTAVATGEYTLQFDLPGGAIGINIPPRTVTVNGTGTVTVAPLPVQMREMIYLPTLQRR
jgi:hypothetical protein